MFETIWQKLVHPDSYHAATCNQLGTEQGLSRWVEVQPFQFFTTVGPDRFKINLAPWGEGQLKLNGEEIARTAEANDRRHAFTSLKQLPSVTCAGNR